MYPRIYLAIDNVVFYKRFTRPMEWAKIIADLGVHYVEASADTELDPLYLGKNYLADWERETVRAQDAYGVKVANLFSGHGTYSTLGLAHPDPRVRAHMIRDWFFPMLELAGRLQCGMGFYAHAFEHRVLQARQTYEEAISQLTQDLVTLNEKRTLSGCKRLCIEQMYTPHQYPWQRAHVKQLLRDVTAQSGAPFYFTEDLGHHVPGFARPDDAALRAAASGNAPAPWVGTDEAFALLDRAADPSCDQNTREILLADVQRKMDEAPHMFCERENADCYTWLRELGCYSPIIHLQQTDGTTSSHLPFTEERNAWGKIHPAKVLRALKEAYDAPPMEGMPPRAEEIYLTLELFSGTCSVMPKVLAECKESVSCWREAIPEDGIRLDELTARLG